MSPEIDSTKVTRKGIDAVCDAFEAEWRGGQKPRIEDYFERLESTARTALLKELLLVEWELLEERGGAFQADEYVTRFPNHAAMIRRLMSERQPTALALEVGV